MNRSLTLGLSVALLCAGTAQAKKNFLIDHRGAKPSKYRITAMSQFIYSHISPSVFKTSLFNKTGKYIKETNIGLEIGVENGQTLLLLKDWSHNGGDGGYDIVGNASNLDNMLPLKGIKFRGYQEWDMLSLAWRLKCEVEPGMTLKNFKGELFGYKHAMERLLANVASQGKTETAANMKVLVSFYRQHWWHLIPSSQMQDVGVYEEKANEIYFTPITDAAAAYDPAQKKALSEVNETVIEGLSEVVDYYNEQSQNWVPQAKKDMLAKLLGRLQKLQSQLER